MKLLTLQYASALCYLVPLETKYISQHHILTHTQPLFLPSVSETKFRDNIKQRTGLYFSFFDPCTFG